MSDRPHDEDRRYRPPLYGRAFPWLPIGAPGECMGGQGRRRSQVASPSRTATPVDLGDVDGGFWQDFRLDPSIPDPSGDVG